MHTSNRDLTEVVPMIELSQESSMRHDELSPFMAWIGTERIMWLTHVQGGLADPVGKLVACHGGRRLCSQMLHNTADGSHCRGYLYNLQPQAQTMTSDESGLFCQGVQVHQDTRVSIRLLAVEAAIALTQ